MTLAGAVRADPAADEPSVDRPRPAFAHASEAELARIFDFYAVAWEYEPHVFPLLWNLDGDVIESFTPDFYLPDFDLYVELTTLRQPLVRKKNRKLRRLRELYPGVRIKLFYARDFRALMLKYGKVALVGALSGTSGQVVPAAPLQHTPPDTPPVQVPVPAAVARPSSVAAAPVEGAEAAAEPSIASPSTATRRRRARRRRAEARAAVAGARAAEADA
jgi:hypothetical protein